LSDYWVFVSNTPFADSDTPATLSVRASTWSFHQTSQPNPNTVLAVPNFYGRYVRVQLSGTNYLSLAELQVMASSGSPPPPGSITCNNQTVTTGGQAVQTVPTQPSQIGGAPVSIFQINFANSCAIVQVTKNADGTTKIDSRGYNTCDTSVSRRFERGITITY
jgi:hypothetical protein